MTSQVGANWRPDGPVRYRTDPGSGEWVGILPATCKQGRHSLSRTGYTARTVQDTGVLRVECTACVAVRDADYAWSLVLHGPPPARAELDDGPYADIDTFFTVTRVRRG